MANEMTVLDLSQLPSCQMGSDAAFDELAKGADFLKFVKLYTKGPDIDRGRIRPGHWGIPGISKDDPILDLGDSIDIVPLARRPKALDSSDKSAPIVSYDETSDTFKAIQAKSMEKDSGCQHGISYLVFERSTNQFLEVWFGNKSSRPEAKNLVPYMMLTQADIDRRATNKQDVAGLAPHGPRVATLKVRLAENKQGQTWHVPMVLDCSTPVRLPATEAIVKEIQRFLTVKSGGVEKVQEEAKHRRAR
jgi:hypothetical protein